MSTSEKGETSPNSGTSQSYKFRSLKKHGGHVTFEFSTQFAVKYEVYFTNYSGLFEDYPDITCAVYCCGIEVAEGDPSVSPLDKKVGATIAEIIEFFFAETSNVIVYVCDSLDNRELARKRKFDDWFARYNDGSYIKHNGVAVIDGNKIYNSLILHNRNEQRHLVANAFDEVNRWAERIEK